MSDEQRCIPTGNSHVKEIPNAGCFRSSVSRARGLGKHVHPRGRGTRWLLPHTGRRTAHCSGPARLPKVHRPAASHAATSRWTQHSAITALRSPRDNALFRSHVQAHPRTSRRPASCVAVFIFNRASLHDCTSSAGAIAASPVGRAYTRRGPLLHVVVAALAFSRTCRDTENGKTPSSLDNPARGMWA